MVAYRRVKLHLASTMRRSLFAHLLAAGFVVGATAGTCHAFLQCLLFGAVCSVTKYRPYIPLLLVGCLIGAGEVGIWRIEHQLRLNFSKSISYTGTISEAPDIRSDHQLLTVTPDGSTGRVLVRTNRYPLRQYGDRLQITGQLEHPSTLNGFDYPLFLERFSILGTQMQPKKVVTVGYHPENPLIASLYQLRSSLEQRINSSIEEPEASLLAGILLGSKRAIPADIQADLQVTGTTHIVAISGENITVLFIILMQVIPVISYRHKFWLTFILAIFIALLTGNSASVIRGAAIGCLIAFVRSHSRRAWPFSLLLCGITLCLVANPLLLAADPGFQLSCSAFAGLLFVGPLVSRWFSTTGINRLPEIAVSAGAETLAATAGTLPLDLHLFGQLSLIGFLVNPLVLWLIPPITILGLLYLVASTLPGIGALIAIPLWLLLHTMLGLIGWFGNLGFGVLHLQINWWVVALLYAVLYFWLRAQQHDLA